MDTWLNNDPVHFAEWLTVDEMYFLPTYVSNSARGLFSPTSKELSNDITHPVIRNNFSCSSSVFMNSRSSFHMLRIPCNEVITQSVAVCEELEKTDIVVTHSYTGDSMYVLLSNATLIAPKCQSGSDFEHTFCLTNTNRPDCKQNNKNNICLDFILQHLNTCLTNQYKCKNGMCILSKYVCDGYVDCPGKDDEIEQCALHAVCHEAGKHKNVQYCFKYCYNFNCICSINYFQCHSGGCIPINKYCDHINDCTDKSDEDHCAYPHCQLSEYTCDDKSCIPLSLVCNTFRDCNDGSDEINCLVYSLHNPLVGREDLNTEQTGLQCGEDYPSYISVDMLCKLIYDRYGVITNCANGWHLRSCSTYKCPGYFKCHSSYCIPVNYICDGKPDCIEGDDEIMCANYSCPGLFRCRSTQNCISQTSVCDDIFDCPYNDDEDNCFDYQCPDGCICDNYRIDCVNESLNDIPSKSSSHLYIHFRHNKLKPKYDTFATHYVLRLLDISFNNIEIIPIQCFEALFELISLNISNNNIRNVEATHFGALRNLQDLILNNNAIIALPDGVFANLTSVSTVYLSHNKISHIGKLVYADTILQTLDLRLNPLGRNGIHMDSFASLKEVVTIYSDAYYVCCFIKTHRHCIAPKDVFSSCPKLLDNNFLKMSSWTIAVTSLLANVISIFIQMLSYTRTGNMFKLMIMKLHLSDSFMGLYLLWIAVTDYRYTGVYYKHHTEWTHSVTCKMLGVINMYSAQTSVAIITCMAVIRYIVIVIAPFKKIVVSRKKTLLIIASISIYNFTMCLVPVMNLSYLEMASLYLVFAC